MNRENFKVSVVVPAFNESGNLVHLAASLESVLSAYSDYEVIFVDDGSYDDTLVVMEKLNLRNSKLKYLSLSRNFGHQSALKAGLDIADGDCVITMDADLQHPPELIPALVRKWEEGFDIVNTIRKDNEKISLFKRVTSNLFYRILNRMANIHMEQGMADFRLMDRAVVDVLKGLKEYQLFLRGMIVWVGFRQFGLEYTAGSRLSGTSKYSLRDMLRFAVTGITAFSLKPLKISILLGVLLAGFSFLYAVYAVYMRFFSQSVMPGWASVLVSVLFIGGVQLVVLGIIGEYIGKVFLETKGRPHYIIRKRSDSHQPNALPHLTEKTETPLPY